MFNNNQKQTCAISMSDLGISTVVMTSIEDIEWIEHQYETQPDSTWHGGRGKRFMHKFLKKDLQAQEVHFNKHPELINEFNEEWTNFCDDCILLFVLDAHLFDKPYQLIHPDSFMKNLNKAGVDATGGVTPDLIPGIPVIN